MNHKGGVGKTTVTANLGAGIALKGFKVLVIDLDIQCNLTQTLLNNIGDSYNICDVLLAEEKINDKVIQNTKIDNLKIVPAGENLVDADINLFPLMGRESILKNSLSIVTEFDFVLIDNPPYTSLLTINSLVASEYVLVPVSCEFLPLVGLKYLLNTIQRIKKLNNNISILGYVLTMYDARESITTQVEQILRNQFSELVFESKIRINTKAKAAPSKTQTIFEYEEMQGRGSSDFANLTIEFLERINRGK